MKSCERNEGGSRRMSIFADGVGCEKTELSSQDGHGSRTLHGCN